MPKPTSARARSSMSKSKARRQAHRESHLYRLPGLSTWYLDAYPEDDLSSPLHRHLNNLRRSDAVAALAAWRAERVRELMGGASDGCDRCRRYGNDVNNPVNYEPESCPLRLDP